MAAGRQGAVQAKHFLIAAMVAAVIVYGSLYPFDFRFHGNPAEAVAALLASWRGWTSRGDIISNVLLYIPFGLFAVNSLGAGSRIARAALATTAGLVLCLGVELIQFYQPSRSSAMSDVYCNTAGTFIGAVAGTFFHAQARLPLVKHVAAHPVPALLLAAYAGDRLFPYVPAIDLHKYWDALKPLVFNPIVTPEALLRHAAAWLAIAVLVEALFGGERRKLIFMMLVPAVLIIRVVIVGTILSPAEVCGAALAVLLWLAVLSHLPFRAGAVALLLIGSIVVQSLAPFHFQTTPRPFGWTPFLSFMQGSIEVNVRSMFAKVFTYGSLLWLLVRSGLSLGTATTLSTAMVLALRYAQTYMPGRSAEITDCLMVLILAMVIRLMPDETPVRPQASGRTAAATR